MELKTSASFSFSFFLLFLFLCQLSVSSTSINDLLPSGPISGSAGLAAFRDRSGCSDHRCGGLVAEDAEFQLDSEINRRLLASGGRSDSYATLDPNKPVCYEKSGKPYNCAAQGPDGHGRPTCGQNYYRCRSEPRPAPAN